MISHTSTFSLFRAALVTLAAAMLTACGNAPDAAAQRTATTQDTHDAALIARGRYLAKAADCAACHTSPDSAPFAGGVKLDSPFGTFYGSNITPDKQHGIGQWSADEFYTALHDGKSPNGQLYPAMPYTSYRQMSREDSDAIYAYLMSQKPAAVVSREADLSFPFNVRFAVRFWKTLFLEDTLPDASQGHSADWNRGRYVVNALGHCIECHTPRGRFGQLDLTAPFAGGTLGRVIAPSLTPQGLAERGWSAADLTTYLATGIASQGSAFGEMHSVVHLSSQYMTPDDLRAVSTYLLGDRPSEPVRVQAQAVDATQLAPGRRLYLSLCAGCHGADGEGVPHVAVPMRGNSTVRQSNPHNLIVSMLDGIDEQSFPGLERMQAMPGFASKLSDDELAQLANYLRATWGEQPADVSADSARGLRH